MNLTLPSTDFGVDIPFVQHLGLVLTVCANGASEVRLTPRPEFLNSFGVAHGGVIMTLLDVAMAMAARSELMHTGAVTIEMKTTFMRPSVGTLVARGRVIQNTATLAFTEASVFDEHDKLCAHATGTFKYVRRLVSGTRQMHDLNRSSVPVAPD